MIFDRDGTLIRHIPYLKNPNEVELMPGVVETLNLFAKKDYKFGFYSNQSGIGRKLLLEDEVDAVNKTLLELLNSPKFEIFFYCPHIPEEKCNCRKPNSSFALEIFEAAGVDFDSSLYIGDNLSDMEFAKNCNLRGIHLTRQKCDIDSHLDFANYPEISNWAKTSL